MQNRSFPNHLDCQALTGITVGHLPNDGSLGRVRRYTKGTDLWIAEDAADRVYFLRRGRVAVMTATPEHRPVLLRTIEVDQSFRRVVPVHLTNADPGNHGHRPDRV